MHVSLNHADSQLSAPAANPCMRQDFGTVRAPELWGSAGPFSWFMNRTILAFTWSSKNDVMHLLCDQSRENSRQWKITKTFKCFSNFVRSSAYRSINFIPFSHAQCWQPQEKFLLAYKKDNRGCKKHQRSQLQIKYWFVAVLYLYFNFVLKWVTFPS